jgi:hydroxymethylbilane synthase
VTAIRIATRGSDLALWQAHYIAGRIERELDAATEILPLETTGDRLKGSLAKVGGKGLFVKEIEEALLDGRADLAIHSAKDLPAIVQDDLPIVAVPQRADPRDALCTRDAGASLATLREGARVGTGSVRRGAQLRRYRADLEMVPLRGNVPTRLRKIQSDDLDAVILACAGLERLGLAQHISERISPEVLLPSVAQGALAVQARKGDSVAADLARLDDADSAVRFAAERAFLSRLGGDCSVPIASLAELQGEDALRLRALVISPDASEVAEADIAATRADAARAGHEAADRILAAGGEAILERARAEAT